VERAKANLVERFNLQLPSLHNFSLIDCIGALYSLLSPGTDKLVSCIRSPGPNVSPQLLLRDSALRFVNDHQFSYKVWDIGNVQI